MLTHSGVFLFKGDDFMNKIFLIMVALCTITVIAFSDYFDSKMKKWSQPNGVEFTARFWGDEFASQMQTNDGYMIVSGEDGYFYYAMLNLHGEYIPSNKRVGIDQPLAQSRNLKRSNTRIANIQSEIEQIQSTRKDRRRSIFGNGGSGFGKIQTGGIDTCKLAVLLIDFTPTNRDTFAHSYQGYFKNEFDSSFFSTNYWNLSNFPHPDADSVFGSVRDYYRDQSYGKLDIIGDGASKRSIINPLKVGSSTLPQWVTLGHSKTYWGESKAGLMNDAIAAADTQITGFDPDDWDVICLIYAGAGSGSMSSGDATWPNANGNVMAVREYSGGQFAHIGTAVHEFGHAYLGASDEYNGTTDPDVMSIMSYGSYNGPTSAAGSCPAPFSPIYKTQYGWVTPVVKTNSTNDTLKYNASAPIIWRINIPNSDEYFLMERKLKTGFDLYTPTQESGTPDGIFIWHAKEGTTFDLEEFEYSGQSDNYRWKQIHSSFSGTNTNKRDGSVSNISAGTLTWSGSGSGGVLAFGAISSYASISSNTTYTSNQAWTQNYQIANGVTVTFNSSAELTIDPGVTIIMGSGSNIVANAKVTANGTSLNKIGLVPISGTSPGSWGSFTLNGSSTSGSVLSYLDFKYGTELKTTNAPSVVIQNSTFTETENGLHFYNSNGWSITNTIWYPQDHGIIANNSTIASYFNTIRKSDRTGAGILYTAGSYDYVRKNDIRGFEWGAGISWGSSPTFGHPSLDNKNNHILDNDYGLMIYEESYPLIGSYDYEYDGKNGIYDNDEKNSYIYAYSDVDAYRTWWGANPPDTDLFYTHNNSSLNYDPYLTSNPFDESSMLESPPSILDQKKLPVTFAKVVKNQIDKGRDARDKKEYGKAIDIFKGLLADPEKRKLATFELYKTMNDTTKDEILTTLNQQSDLGSNIATHLSALTYLKYGDYQSAKNKYDALKGRVGEGSKIPLFADLQLFYFKLFQLGDKKSAGEMLTSIRSSYSDQIDNTEIKLAQHSLNNYSEFEGGDSRAKQFSKKSIVGIPEIFELAQNYPNPFNPTTTINYSLPAESFVSLKIYNILGQIVSVVLNDQIPAGKHSVKFNADKLSSGTYFYRLDAGGFTSIKKLMILK